MLMCSFTTLLFAIKVFFPALYFFVLCRRSGGDKLSPSAGQCH